MEMQAKPSFAQYCIASMQSTGINFVVYLQGTLHPWMSLLEKRRDLMVLLTKSGREGVLHLLIGVRSLLTLKEYV